MFDLRKITLNFFWLGVVFLSIGLAIFLFSIDDLPEKVEQAGIWAPLLFIVAKAGTLVFAPVGGTPLYAVSGALFGTLNGFLYLLIADFIGATICFLLSRRFGRPVLRYVMTKQGLPLLERVIDDLSSKRGFYETSLYFIYFQEFVSYAAGLGRISMKDFFLSRIILFPLPTLLVAWVSSNAYSLSDTESRSLLALLGILVVLGLWRLYRRTRSGR